MGAGGLLSPGGKEGCLSILTYHRVLPERDPLQPPEHIDASCFDKQMAAVRSYFNVLPLPESLDMLAQDRLPKRALSITFDDGYDDNHSVALPILQKHGLTATFFICTGYLGNGLMFNDLITEAIRVARGPDLDLSWLGLGQRSLADTMQRHALIRELIKFAKYLPKEQRQEACDRLWEICAQGKPRPTLMMNPQQVKSLTDSRMSIGGHTHTHPILSKVPLADAEQEIILNRDALSSITGKSPTLFAYPNGRPVTDYGIEHKNLVKKSGYQAAFSTAWGVATRKQDIYQLPRFAPWNVSATRLALQLLKNAHKGRHPTVA